MLHKDQLKEDGVFTEVRFYGCVSKITRLQIATYSYVLIVEKCIIKPCYICSYLSIATYNYVTRSWKVGQNHVLIYCMNI